MYEVAKGTPPKEAFLGLHSGIVGHIGSCFTNVFEHWEVAA